MAVRVRRWNKTEIKHHVKWPLFYFSFISCCASRLTVPRHWRVASCSLSLTVPVQWSPDWSPVHHRCGPSKVHDGWSASSDRSAASPAGRPARDTECSAGHASAAGRLSISLTRFHPRLFSAWPRLAFIRPPMYTKESIVKWSKSDIAVPNWNHLTAMENRMPYGITQCYLPPGCGDFPAFTTAPNRSWYSIWRPQKDARLSWPGWWLHPKIAYPSKTVTYISNNRLGIEPTTESRKTRYTVDNERGKTNFGGLDSAFNRVNWNCRSRRWQRMKKRGWTLQEWTLDNDEAITILLIMAKGIDKAKCNLVHFC